MKCWLVGENESAILGPGWYDRVPDWFGLHCRESSGQASLILPSGSFTTISLLISSTSILKNHHPVIHLEWEQGHQTSILNPALPETGWQLIQIPYQYQKSIVISLTDITPLYAESSLKPFSNSLLFSALFIN